jgi:Tfp pilus assembly protein PilF
VVATRDRLDGWKAIAAYFGRERTTVIRWARERGMPVHAMPGGKNRTVFALASELEVWARSTDVGVPSDPPGAPARQEPARAPRRLLWLACAAAVVPAALFYAAEHRSRGPGRPNEAIQQHAVRALPNNAQAARLFLQARDDWASRSAPELNRAVAELQRVTRIEPDFAMGFADLANAYLLAGEAGSLAPAEAFDGAEHAADRARQLDPNLAAAHRAKGFILYWWKHQAGAAGTELRQAIRLDPGQALSHFWYANMLADAGQERPAMREFDSARLADPGSDQIGADYAWALWIFGQEDEARARLRTILGLHHDIVEAEDCFATIALARGDYAAFLQTKEQQTNLRHEPQLDQATRRLAVAYRDGGAGALLRLVIAESLEDQRDAPYPDHSEAAFYASLAGDRRTLLSILDVAISNRERWGAAGYVRRMRAAWSFDSGVIGKISSLTGDMVEPV